MTPDTTTDSRVELGPLAKLNRDGNVSLPIPTHKGYDRGLRRGEDS